MHKVPRFLRHMRRREKLKRDSLHSDIPARCPRIPARFPRIIEVLRKLCLIFSSDRYILTVERMSCGTNPVCSAVSV